MSSPATRPVRSGAAATAVPVLVGGLVVLAVCVGLSLVVGQGDVPVADAWRSFTDYRPGDPAHEIVRGLRLPRTVLGILVGAALAVAGLLMQTITRNPLAEPGLLGVTAGASFAVVLATYLTDGGDQVSTFVVAVVGAAAATAMVYSVGRTDPLRLVLAGMAVTFVLRGFSLGLRLFDAAAFDRYRFWSVGSLAGRDQQSLLVPLIALGVALLVAVVLILPLGAIEMGDDVATGLGVSVATVRMSALVVATVLAGLATAVAGPITFAGLIVPHIARRFTRGSLGWLFALCLVLGPALLVGGDTLGRVLLPTGDVPVEIVTAVIGGPVLIMLVRRGRTGRWA